MCLSVSVCLSIFPCSLTAGLATACLIQRDASLELIPASAPTISRGHWEFLRHIDASDSPRQPSHGAKSTKETRKKTRTLAKHVGHFSEAIFVCDRNTLANGDFFCDENGQK